SLLLITLFFMADLVIWFVILITLLNLTWLVLSLNMYKPITDYKRYAKTLFVFSLNYILIFYVMIKVAGLIIYTSISKEGSIDEEQLDEDKILYVNVCSSYFLSRLW